MPRALDSCKGPAPWTSLCGFCPPQIIIISWNSSWNWLAYAFIPVGLLFILQNPTFHILPAAFCLIEILMELPPLWMFYVIQCFSCTYLFFYQDCKLLKVQHCTHLPFGNDLDLLRKKKKQFWKVPWIGRLALSTHCGKCFWKTWLNGKTQVMMDQRSGLQLCHSICASSVCPSLQAGWFWWFPACAVCYSYLRAQSALLAPNWGVLGGDLQREHWPKIVTWILVAHLPHPGLRDHGWVHCFSVCPTIPL